MKYILTESKIKQSIKRHLDNMFDVENINSTHPYDYDEDGYEFEDPNRVLFYYGDYSDGDNVFQWYSGQYWSGPQSENYKESSPIVGVVDPYRRQLNSFFGNFWFEPFKEWFTENFNLPVKSIFDEVNNKRKSN